MSKRYEEAIDVEAPEGAIEAFWWRGKHYWVRQVLCRWREAGGWWAEPQQRGGDAQASEAPAPWLAGEAREIWRIDAQASGNGAASGTYEISRDLRSGRWSLSRVWD